MEYLKPDKHRFLIQSTPSSVPSVWTGIIHTQHSPFIKNIFYAFDFFSFYLKNVMSVWLSAPFPQEALHSVEPDNFQLYSLSRLGGWTTGTWLSGGRGEYLPPAAVFKSSWLYPPSLLKSFPIKFRQKKGGKQLCIRSITYSTFPKIWAN